MTLPNKITFWGTSKIKISYDDLAILAGAFSIPNPSSQYDLRQWRCVPNRSPDGNRVEKALLIGASVVLFNLTLEGTFEKNILGTVDSILIQ